jgi:hypothetical protein
MARPNRHIVKVSELLAEARAIAASQDWQRLGTSLDEAQAALLHVGSKNFCAREHQAEAPATQFRARVAIVGLVRREVILA